jgi:hypothetical protein
MILRVRTLKNIINLIENKTQDDLSEVEIQSYPSSDFLKARITFSFKLENNLITIESESENEEH